MATSKPQLSFWSIWNMCFGFLGIQFGFALQNANVSRIFQTLGADLEQLPLLWIAAPLTGLIVQPIIGYMSDRTWNRLGRRRPYFFWGAILTTASLIIMPNSGVLWIAAGTLWIMDASINITMEPFRAFVGDMLPKQQRSQGYVMQSFFIGVGSVIASAMPWVLANWLDVANTAPAGEIPESVRYSFYCGALVLLSSVMWTVYKTKEYSPEQLKRFDDYQALPDEQSFQHHVKSSYGNFLIGIGVLFSAAIYGFGLDAQLYILSVGLTAIGLCTATAIRMQSSGNTTHPFYQIMGSLFNMPDAMKRLAVVQFFSWFALFAMWIYTTAAVTQDFYGSTDPQSQAYNDGADWVSVLFASYNAFAIIAAIVIPFLIKWIGTVRTHQFNLLLGAIGFGSFLIINDPQWLIVSMVGVGFAWASIVSIPYVLLSNSLPTERMGTFMGIFNFFIVIPQLLASSILGLIVVNVFKGEPIYALLVGALFFVMAAISLQWVRHE